MPYNFHIELFLLRSLLLKEFEFVYSPLLTYMLKFSRHIRLTSCFYTQQKAAAKPPEPILVDAKCYPTHVWHWYRRAVKESPTAKDTFRSPLILWVLHITRIILFRHTLHHYLSQDIHYYDSHAPTAFWKLVIWFMRWVAEAVCIYKGAQPHHHMHTLHAMISLFWFIKAVGCRSRVHI